MEIHFSIILRRMCCIQAHSSSNNTETFISGRCHTGRHLRYDDGDKTSIRFADDTTLHFFQMGPPKLRTRLQYAADGPTRYDDESARCVCYRSVVNISPWRAEVSRASYTALLVHACMSEEANINLVENGGLNCILYDGKPGN